jgi:4-amino-4-deoxy-L-arabinose transferase-like glycosyltransferase
VNKHGFTRLGEPTAYRPPAYPLFIAALFNVTRNSIFAIKLIHVVLGVMAVFFTYLIAWNTFNSMIGLIAAGIVAFTPSLISYSSLIASENLGIALFLISIYFLLIYARSYKIKFAVFSGIFLGITGLMRPEVLLLPIIWISYLAFQRNKISRIIKTSLAFLLPAILVILPWTIRNYLQFHHIIPISSNGGIMLLVSFNNQTADRANNTKVFAPLYERALKDGWDEAKTSNYAATEAMHFIRDHPYAAIRLIPIKLYYLFSDDISGISWNFIKTIRPVSQSLILSLKIIAQTYYSLIIISALSTILFWKKLKEYPSAILLLITILYWIIYYSVIITTDRYHLLILPIIAIFSAFGIMHIFEIIKQHATEMS